MSQPPLNILVVDDSPSAADTLALFFELDGYAVRKCYDGETAVRMVAEAAPDLAFLDITMPGMDGYETAKQIQAVPEAKHTVLVALTGWGEEDDVALSREAGFHRHLVKPVEPNRLREVIADLGPELRGHTS